MRAHTVMLARVLSVVGSAWLAGCGSVVLGGAGGVGEGDAGPDDGGGGAASGGSGGAGGSGGLPAGPLCELIVDCSPSSLGEEPVCMLFQAEPETLSRAHGVCVKRSRCLALATLTGRVRCYDYEAQRIDP